MFIWAQRSHTDWSKNLNASIHIAELRRDLIVGWALKISVSASQKGYPFLQISFRLRNVKDEGEINTVQQREKKFWINVFLSDARQREVDFLHSWAVFLNESFSRKLWSSFLTPKLRKFLSWIQLRIHLHLIFLPFPLLIFSTNALTANRKIKTYVSFTLLFIVLWCIVTSFTPFTLGQRQFWL